MNQSGGNARKLLLCLLLAAVVSGCSRSVEGTDPTREKKPLEPVAISHTDNTSEEIQNGKERQLVIFFRGLVLMNRSPGLQITKAEAELLLPIVRKGIENGYISSAESAKMADFLTKEQKSYYNEFQILQVQQANIVHGSDTGEGMSDVERLRLLEELKKRRGEKVQDPDKENSAAVSQNDDDEWGTAEKNIEQQLLELLQNIVKS